MNHKIRLLFHDMLNNRYGNIGRLILNQVLLYMKCNQNFLAHHTHYMIRDSIYFQLNFLGRHMKCTNFLLLHYNSHMKNGNKRLALH